MIVRELLAKLGIQLDKASFSAADVLLAGTKAGVVAIGAAAVAAGAGLIALVHDMVETTGQLNDTSQAIGVNVESLQELGYTAKLNGAGVEELTVGLTILSKHVQAAKEGNEEAAKSFSKLHINIRNASGQIKTSDSLFKEISDKISAMPDGVEKTALALELFGKSGAKLIPTLNLSSKGLAEAAKEARDFGYIISKETVAAGDDLGDNLDRLRAGLKGLGYSIAGPLLPQINELVQSFIVWIKLNRILITQRVDKIVYVLAQVGKGLIVVLDTLYRVLGFVIDNVKFLGIILGSVLLAVILTNITAITTLIGQYIWFGAVSLATAASAAAAWVAAAAGPIALAALIAIVILLVEDLYYLFTGGNSLIGTKLGVTWEKIGQVFRDVVEGWKLIFQDFIDWIVDGFKMLGEKIAGDFNGILDSAKKLLHIGNSSGSAVGGGASGPSASVNTNAIAASTTQGTRVVTSSTTNDIKVYALPGQSVADIASKTREEIEAMRRTELQETAAALQF